MNASKLFFLFLSIFSLQILQSAEHILITEQVSQLWSNAHNEKIKYFNDMNNLNTKPYFLRNAVLDNDETVVDYLLSKGTDITIADNKNASPWFYAVAKNNKNIMKLFLDRGASLEIKDVDGLTPLHFAVKKDDTDTVKLFSEYLPTDAKNWKDDAGKTILFYVQSPEMFELLESMDLLPDSNMQDIEGKTALHYAVIADAINIVEILIVYGADVNVPDKKEDTPLVYALGKNDRQIIKLFLDNNVDIQAPDKNGQNILHFAVKTKDQDLLKLLLSFDNHINFYAKDNQGKTAYHLAVESDNLEILKELVGGGYYFFQDERLADNYGRTPVYYVKNLDVVTYLNELGAITNINQMRDKQGLTPLHYIVRQWAPYELVEFFLESLHADVTIKDGHGLTAYDYALDEAIKKMLEEKTLELLNNDEPWELLEDSAHF
ncbi:ankyrin repeat domain-containing protein [Candidatus Chromulinivorax destructor]|uniref:Uncharacterized protein n=1 Tax=Candidatus Chromulinivorax destructor TaxID=2066483 RepID=A0A345ZA52_9BACT|nr:ankyrin repeat domain-containing protein [Candidatus Chromulinivorax destructor]AXK60169.1 hypothetical protein C0J27_00185 [Candidatus Chromulinivorax destructor]